MAVVLVVDDEFGIANLLKDVLTDEGHRVLLAANGREALERAEAERPDLVLSDFMMPVMDGGDLVNAMAGTAELNAVPIIVMSAIPEETFRERCTAYALFVRKPFKIFDLIDRVAGLLGDKAESTR